MASFVLVGARWRAQIRRKGRKSISKTFRTKAEAVTWARGIEAQLDAGQPVRPAGETVADIVARYRRLRDISRPIADTSNEHYTLRRIAEYFGDMPASRLTADDLVGWATARRDQGAGPYTVNMDISKLGTVLRYAGEGLPDVVGQARPKLSYLGLVGGGGRRERRPTDDEMHRLCEALPQFADWLRFAVLTAMRRSEICRIEWADIDEAKRLVMVRDRKDPRRVGRDEWVPLLGEAWAIVQRQPRVDCRIFPVEPGTVSKAFTGACRRLGIVDLHLHDLRHDGVSRLFEAGYSIEQVAVVSGHRDWRHLRRYTQLRPENLHRD